ncbi:TonB-dependent receptor P26 [subsurface metagenome]
MDDPNATLVFSFVGMQTLEVIVGSQTSINVTMEEETIGIEEVVAIGYGNRDVTGLTGSVASIGMDRIKREPTGNIIKSLKGNIAGVSVVRSKTPGSSGNIKIQGLGTIGNSSPLWVVDGVQVSGYNLSSGEVKSITVLKDAASTAVYGARGANGVILVETIEGSKGQKAQISFTSRYGIQQQYQKHDMLGVYELGEVRYLQQINSGIENPDDVMYKYGPNGEVDIYNYVLPSRTDQVDETLYDREFPWQDGDGTFPITRSNPEGTDWYGAVTRIAPLHEHILQVTGGSENATYGICAGFLEEEASIGKATFDRMNLRINSTIDVTNWLKFGENFHLVRRNNQGYTSQGTSGLVLQSLRIPQIIPLYDIDGYYAPFTRVAGAHGHNNPVASIEKGKRIQSVNLAAMGNVFTEISPIPNLKINSSFGFNLTNSHNRSPLFITPEEITPRVYDELNESYGRGTYWSWTNTATYSDRIGEIHKYEILLGVEFMESTSSNLGASRVNFFQTDDDYFIMNAGEENMINSGSLSDWASSGLFSRLHYELYNRYLADFTLRRDGSSRFGRENRYGTFPSVAVAWRISEEDFMQETNWVDNLKIRLSWGQSGNDRIGNYNGFTTFAGHPILSYYPITGADNSTTAGMQSYAFGNPSTKWETVESINLGVDATFFENFSMDINLWKKNTHDMLYKESIPYVYGVASAPSVNVGEMKNTGFDVGLNYNGTAISNELTYNFSLIIGHFKNEIVKLSDDAGEFIRGPMMRQMYYTRAEEGTSYPAFYGLQVDGIFQTQEEAESHPPAFAGYNAPGRFKFRDVNEDGVIDSDDRTYIGNPHPDFIGSVSGGLSFKQFDFSFQLFGSYGNDIMNVERRLLDFNFFQTNRGIRRLYESWGSPYLEDNKDAKMPIAEQNDADSQRPSSYFVEDGSYLRLQNAELGYSLDLPSISFRIYVMVTDLFTITKTTVLDPEVSWDGMRGGVVEGGWAIPRRFMIGVQLDL